MNKKQKKLIALFVTFLIITTMFGQMLQVRAVEMPSQSLEEYIKSGVDNYYKDQFSLEENKDSLFFDIRTMKETSRNGIAFIAWETVDKISSPRLYFYEVDDGEWKTLGYNASKASNSHAVMIGGKFGGDIRLDNNKVYKYKICNQISNIKYSCGQERTFTYQGVDIDNIIISDIEILKDTMQESAVAVKYKTDQKTRYTTLVYKDIATGKTWKTGSSNMIPTNNHVAVLGGKTSLQLVDGKKYSFNICVGLNYDENQSICTEEQEFIYNNKLKNNQIEKISKNANLITKEQFDLILGELSLFREKVKEQESKIKYLESLKKDVEALTEKVEKAINDFITYGVDANTRKLGAGERAAVVSSYKSAFNKLPETEAEFEDTFKIANGRWPSKTNEVAESRAKESFKKIYKRDANMDNQNDNAAVTVMAYGLRQKAENRNLDSEKNGIKIFKGVFGYNPSTTNEWNMMQAITYSGASR